MTISVTSIVWVAWLAQAVSPAAEAENKTRAKALLGEGSALYKRGDYAGALEKFQAAYAAFPSPKLWFNIGQAHRDLGRPVEALDAFEIFVQLATDAPPDALADARTSIETLRKRLAQVRIECAIAGAELHVDGKPLGVAPLPEWIWVTPGRHQITATRADAALAIAYADLLAGEVKTVVLGASSPGEGRPGLDLRAQPGPDERGWWLGRKWTWVAAGSTVVLTGAASIAGLMMQSRFDELRASCGRASGKPGGCSADETSSLDNRKLAANVLWAAAGVAALSTVALFFVEGRAVAVAPLAGESNGLMARVAY